MTIKPSIFRDYDIRAIIPDELDMEGVKRIAQATYNYFKPKTLSIGCDARNTGPEIKQIFIEVFLKSGVDITDLGKISTDMMTFASGQYNYDLSIQVTASHNPAAYNGFKMAQKGGRSVSGPTGFYAIRDLALSDKNLEYQADKSGQLKKRDIYKDWIDFCLSFIDLSKIKPFKAVIDAGNGIAGQIFGHPYLKEKLPVEIVPLYFEPDGDFPNHIPDPLKEENRRDLVAKVEQTKADFGAIVDGDGDRISFITETGQFVTGSVVTAMIAENILKDNPGAMILYNAVCSRAVPKIISKNGGQSQRTRVGYSLIKKDMEETGALFAGEHSAHFFYKQTYNSESSLLTFLMILSLISQKNKTFDELINIYNPYSQSGEINFEVEDKQKVMKTAEETYQDRAEKIDWLDGISIWFDNGWVSLRSSNTQPLLRLNVEADTKEQMEGLRDEFRNFILSHGGKPFND